MSNPLLATFIPEARDLIQISAAGLLKLEKEPDNSDAVNEVFRAVHTLKGSSGLFEAVALTRLVHAAEDLLGAIRSASLELDSDLVDKLLDSLDMASTWIDHLERHEKMPPDADALSSGLLRELRLYATADVAPASHAPKAASDALDRSAPDRLAGIEEGDRLAAFSAIASGARVIGLFYRPAEGCFFNGDDPLNLIRQIPELIAVCISERSSRAPLAEIDPYLCNIDIGALSAAPLDEIDHLFRYMPEQMETLTLKPEWLVGLAGAPGEPEPIGDFSTEAERLLETEDFEGLRNSASRLYDLADRTSVLASALRWLIAVLNQQQPDCAILGGLLDAAASGVYSGPRRPTRVQRSETDVKNSAPLINQSRLAAQSIISAQRRILDLSDFGPERLASMATILGNLCNAMDIPIAGGELKGAVAAAGRGDLSLLRAALERIDRHLKGGPAPAKSDVHEQIHPQAAASRAAAPDGAPEAAAQIRTLKVDTAKVDDLLNLAGELVVSKNSLPFLARRAEEVYGSREMAREIRDRYSVIHRLAQEIQGAIMAVRMLPVSEIFDRYPRVVRDMARKLGKRIELNVDGGDTAADKTIIEAINDPLLHVLRNSIDHGLETPEQRIAAGKTPEGRLSLRAFRESDQVVIEIEDNGAGVDPAAVRAAAINKDVIDAESAALLSDQETINLIFRPGFSTAKVVTDLSGRGVGMDVVRTTIEKLGGSVALTSRVGEGTTIRMSLPLSMAVTRVMMVEAAGALYGVPMDVIVETVRLPRERIRAIKNGETFVLRNTVIPLARMTRLLRLPEVERSKSAGSEAVLVCRVNGNPVGLVIDNFLEDMEVILKPLDGILTGIRGFAGTTLLGDGRVLLVLNLKELL